MKVPQRKWDTDVCMTELYRHFVSDFRRTLGLDSHLETIYKSHFDLKSYRENTFPTYSSTAEPLFKWLYQHETLFKRYTFSKDMYTVADLEELTKTKFLKTQERIASGYRQHEVVSRVVRETRRIIAHVLGDYDKDEHIKYCKFGKKSDVGNTLRQAFLDLKVGQPITGTYDQIAWFDRVVSNDALLLRGILESQSIQGLSLAHSQPTGINYEICDTLTLVNVPKSWKSLRSIMPNTRIGVFYTNGLHGYLSDCLRKRAHLDIRSLQTKHGELAKDASINGRLVTADLSAASDSLSIGVMRALLPSKWFKVFSLGRVPYCNVGDQKIRLESFMTMGLGFTFCLQTLVFYSLLRAIAVLIGKPRAFVSVYGDDLIYHRILHPYVVKVFPYLHLQLNEDKTYATGHFRESCGSDYHSGTDVRPFCFQGEHQTLTRTRFASFLYKLLNGFLRRWAATDIPNTVRFLLNQIVSTGLKVFVVPTSYPDDSGFKIGLELDDISDYFCYVDKVHWELPRFSCKHCIERAVISWIRTEYPFRFVPSQTIYLWESLRPKGEFETFIWEDRPDTTTLRWLNISQEGKKSKRLYPYVVNPGGRSRVLNQKATLTHW